MSSLTRKQLDKIATAAKYGEPFGVHGTLYDTTCVTKIYSKGRPRVVRGGTHTFTPPNTVKFEKALAKHYTKDGAPMLMCRLRACVVLFDKLPAGVTKDKKALALMGLVFSTTGDVDNRAKSVLDAANGILFADDAQIVNLQVSRKYTEGPERVQLTLHRAGLSPAETTNVLARMKAL